VSGAESATDVDRSAETNRLTDEVRRLRAELNTSRAVSARALARATRLAQLVSALGKVTGVADVFERAVSEVAELFDADIAVILIPPADGRAGVSLAAQWGIAARGLPPEVVAQPADTRRLTSVFPVVAGPVADFAVPEWIANTQPRHVSWGLLTVRDEHLGYLLLLRRAERPFELADIHELTAVVSRIALAVDNGRLYRRTQDQLHRLQRLNEVTAGLAGVVDVARGAQHLVETLVADVPVAGAAVYLCGTHGHEFVASAGAIKDCPARVAVGQVPTVAGTVSLNLGLEEASVGTLLLTDAPAPGSDARSFLEHLADVGGLVLEKAVLFQRIRAQAETDVLTGMPNRAHFMEHLSSALALCRQSGTDLAVIFVDMDGFKAVNDTHGHDAGDQLLIAAGRRLTEAAGPSGMAARLGGDEFVVACADITPDAVRSVADRIQRAMDAPYLLHLRDNAVKVTAGGSIGIGMARDSGYDAALLLSKADAAMYAAKQHRRSPKSPPHLPMGRALRGSATS